MYCMTLLPRGKISLFCYLFQSKDTGVIESTCEQNNTCANCLMVFKCPGIY